MSPMCRYMSYHVHMAVMTTTTTTLDQITWGDRLRRLRINRHMTQNQFADSIGLSRPAIGQYELMDDEPRAHRLVENSVELVYGREAADFLRGLPHRDSNTEPAGYVFPHGNAGGYRSQPGRLRVSRTVEPATVTGFEAA